MNSNSDKYIDFYDSNKKLKRSKKKIAFWYEHETIQGLPIGVTLEFCIFEMGYFIELQRKFTKTLNIFSMY